MTVVKLKDNNQPLTFLILAEPIWYQQVSDRKLWCSPRLLFVSPSPSPFPSSSLSPRPHEPRHRFDIDALVIAEGWHPPRLRQLLLIRDPPISIFGGWRRRPGTSGSLGLGRGVKI